MKAFSLIYKRLLFAVILLIATNINLSAKADGDGRRWFFVETKNGITNAFIIHDKATFTVEKDSLVLRSSELETAYLKSRVKKFYTYTDEELFNNIEDVKNEAVTLERTPDGVIIKGLPEGETVGLFGINGVEYTQTSSTLPYTTITLTPLPSGIYIITSPTLGSVKVLNSK